MVGGRDYFEKIVDENFKNEKLFFEIGAKFNSFKISESAKSIGQLFKSAIDQYVPTNSSKDKAPEASKQAAAPPAKAPVTKG